MDIKITCEGAGLIDFSALEPFQNNLKNLHKTEFEKLKQSIIKHGISAPFFLWGNKCLDGHQRIRVISEMLKNGFTLKDGLVPYVKIEADTKKEAKEKILLFASYYGKITNESLYEFLNIEDLNFGELKDELDLPEIDLKEFESGYVGREAPQKKESECPQCHYRW